MKDYKKTKKLGVLMTVLLLLLSLTMFACDNETVQPTYNIKFHTNGGNEIGQIQTNGNEQLKLPIPVKEGYEFKGVVL